MPELRIWQIYYHDIGRAALDPNFTPYDNTHQADEYLENSVIARLIPEAAAAEAGEDDYLGVFSWKFRYKVGYGYEGLLKRLGAGGADVYSFFAQGRVKNVWQKAEQWHPGILRLANALGQRLGWGRLDKLATPVIWQNHFLARPAVYRRYVTEALLPAMRLMDDRTDAELQDRLWTDSRYRQTELRRDAVLRAHCVSVFGVPFYPMHPFVLERLMSTWLALNAEVSFARV